MKPCCVILGGGGHARVLIDCIQVSANATIHGILEPNRALWGSYCLDVPILGGDELLADLSAHGVTHFVVGLGGTGDNAPRARLFEQARAQQIEPLTVQHPTALVSRWARVGMGSQLLPYCVINAGAQIGTNVIVNTSAVVEHDCVLGDHVHIATGARLASAVRVGDGAHVGAGATIRQGISIGAGAIVGAGAVVVQDVAPQTTVVGVPARVPVKI